MTKFSLRILTVLNDNNVETPSEAMSVNQILTLMEEKQRKSYSTTYSNLLNMTELGYLKCGLCDGLASTYFITESGKLFCKAQEKSWYAKMKETWEIRKERWLLAYGRIYIENLAYSELSERFSPQGIREIMTRKERKEDG